MDNYSDNFVKMSAPNENSLSSISDFEITSETNLEIDPNRLIYDLKELNAIPTKMFFAKRDHIRYGYRANPNMTICKCSKTLFMTHCETGNVWTHLLSGLYFCYHLALLINNEYPYTKFETE